MAHACLRAEHFGRQECPSTSGCHFEDPAAVWREPIAEVRMIGSTISHYKILEKLGEGGMGVVYKAQDTKLNRFAALKFLPAHLSASEQDKARFIQEAQAAAALNHPNICTIYGIEEHEGQVFIAMEFVEGQTLRDKGLNIPLKQSIEIGIQLADGLSAAHEKGIVHRDIKPENIMLQKDGRVRIMDFGLAKLKSASRLTKAGSTVGTTGYMSPEQVQGLESDHRSDIFSLGVILYELFSGQSPFKGVHETAINYEIVNVDPEPISAVRTEIAPELDGVILECLAKEQSERYQSVAEVVKELRRYKRESSRTRVSRVSAAYRPSQIKGGGSVAAEEAVARTPAWWRNYSLLAAILFFLVSVAFVLLYFAEPMPAERVYRSSLLPPEKMTIVTLLGGQIALSPDGQLIAFPAKDTTGKVFLWVRSLNALTGQALNGTEDASFPFWSPDSRAIGFFAAGKLKKIDAAGGPPQSVCDAAGGRGGTWNKAGIIVFSPNAPPGNVLWRVSAAGGTPVAITKLDTSRNEQHHRWPYFLPDGEHFFYTSRTASGGVGETDAVALGSLDTAFTPRFPIGASSNASYANGHLLFVREQSLLARPFDAKKLEFTGDAFPIAEQVHFEPFTSRASFSVSENGLLAYQTGLGSSGIRLIWYDRSGKQTGAIDQIEVYNDLHISPDGKRLAVSLYNNTTRNTDIWLYEIARVSRTRFTFDPAADRWPVWSPDGSTIVFTSTRKRQFNFYQRPSSGAASEELLLESEADKSTPNWSSDGKFIAFTATYPKSKDDIWVLPVNSKEAAGKGKPFVFLQTDFNETRPTFSPDGGWMAYQSDESSKNEIYVRPFPGAGGKWQVSTQGGTRPHWRHDGKELFFLGSDNKIWSAQIKLGGSTVDVGAIAPLFQVNPFTSAARDVYDVTADGQRFVVATPGGEEVSSPITLVVNWTADLKKK